MPSRDARPCVSTLRPCVSTLRPCVSTLRPCVYTVVRLYGRASLLTYGSHVQQVVAQMP
ncbi:MAG: hypothetical protein VSS75_022095 [Candidatus Parabeggiatoa sp.]|nr:hypothetical protein [Candidatus Parabeggiatoa sp.]